MRADGGGSACGRVPMQHRSQEKTCDHERPPGVASGPADPIPAGESCVSDSQCTHGENGRCNPAINDDQHCTYDDCFADKDCKAGPCVCGETDWNADANVCLMGNCHTDADCGAHGYCSPSFGECGPYLGVVAYYCHTCDDDCVDDADCYPDQRGDYCLYNPAVARWVCGEAQCEG
jgi:hypothetical protein